LKKIPRLTALGASVLLVLGLVAGGGCSSAPPGSTGGGGAGTTTSTGAAACTPGATESCYEGPAGTEGVGICKAGTHTCLDDGSGFEACMGQVEPQDENCDTPADEDCDGQAQSEVPGCCAPGASVGCYSGPPATEWIGICKPGTKICNVAGTGFSACVGEVLPQIESCETPVDDDCDGSVSDGEIDCCKDGDSRACYDGPAGTAGVGLCVGGTQVCNGNGSGFGPCVGQVLPAAEQCGTSDDESCDGSSSCTGSFAWSRRFGNKNQTATAAVDKGGNVALFGSFDETTDLGGGILTSAGATDVYLAKLTLAGATIFSKRFGNLSSQSGNAVAFDLDGNIYLAGSFQGTIDFGGGPLTSAGSDDAFLVKLDPKGKQVWAKRYGGSSSEAALFVGVDKLGNVYASGTFSGSVDLGGGLLTSAGGNDIFVLGLDKFGNHLWSKRAGNVGSDLVGSMDVGQDGGVYLTGRFAYSIDFGSGSLTSAGGDDLFAVKLDEFGDPLWAENAGDLSGQSGTAIAVSVLGDVFLGGDFQGSIDLGQGTLVSAGASDVFLARLDSSGSPVWAQQFGDAADQHLTSVAVDTSGNVTMTGQFQGTIDFGDGPHTSAGGNDIFVAKLDASGLPLWSKTFGDATFAQGGKSISADPSGGVVIAGTFAGAVDFGGGSLVCKGTSNAFVTKLQP
jgi:hypothetical protein